MSKIFPAVTGISKVPDELADTITDEELNKLTSTLTNSGVLEGKAKDGVIEGLKLIRDIKGYIYEYFID